MTLEKRAAAYRRHLNANPDIPVEERRYLFSLMVWPERQVLTWEHLQQCREKDCRLCEEGELVDSAA